MCEALRKLMADELKAAETKGKVIGEAIGEASGLNKGIEGSVTLLRSVGVDDSDILDKICAQYNLSEEDAKKYL